MSLIGDLLAPYALIASPGRAIGTIFPDVVVEEIHTDDLAITDHPVESGAAISDHAFLLPCRVEMRCGFSDSTAGTEGYVQEVYAALLALQRQREPFDVYTGKRVYSNMLIGRLSVENSEKTENALMVICGLREVIITETQQTGAPQGAQAMPERTGSVTDTGTNQAIASGTGTGSIVSGSLAGSGIGGLSSNGVFFGQDTTLSGSLIGSTPGGGSFAPTVGGFTGPSPF